MAVREELKNSALFREAPEEAVDMAIQAATFLRYQRGEVLIQQDALGEALYLLTSGTVRVSREGLGGRERLLNHVYAPAVLGESSVLLGSARSATVTADGAVSALVLYREDFERILSRHPRVLWNLARMLALRVTQQNDELIAAGVSTEANIAQAFQQLYRQRVEAGVPRPEQLPLSMQDLTMRVLSSRETANRLIKKFTERGLIRQQGNIIELLDLDGLDELLYEFGDS